MQIKVMSWNTWLSRNIDGVTEHILQTNPDIIGLQEIVEGYPNPKDPNSSKIIQDRLANQGLGYNLKFFPAFKTDRHTTEHIIGNAILSRYPIISAYSIFLSNLEMYKKRDTNSPPRDAEPRIAIIANIKIGKNTIKVINTHLGISEKLKPTIYTNIQMSRLMKLIGVGKNTILMGDFNSPHNSEYIKRINNVLQNTDKKQEPTWPLLKDAAKRHNMMYGKEDRLPKLLTERIDQIFIGNGIKVDSFTLGNSKASDHKSLIAILEI